MEKYSIHIAPENIKEFKKITKEFSKKLNKYGALEDTPHFTIITTFKTKKIKEIIKEIKNMRLKKFQLRIIGPKIMKNNFIYLYPQNSKEIKNLHNKLIEIIPKYKSKWTLEGLKKIKLNKKQKEYLKKYGDPYCKEFFIPHLTIAGFNFNKKELDISKKILKEKFSKIVLIKNIIIKTKINNKWKIYKKITI